MLLMRQTMIKDNIVTELTNELPMEDFYTDVKVSDKYLEYLSEVDKEKDLSNNLPDDYDNFLKSIIRT